MDPIQDHGPDTGDFLTEMVQGASFPDDNDASYQHSPLPSVPRPDQRDDRLESSQFNSQRVSEPTTASTADNTGAMSQDTSMDMRATDGVNTSMGKRV